MTERRSGKRRPDWNDVVLEKRQLAAQAAAELVQKLRVSNQRMEQHGATPVSEDQYQLAQQKIERQFMRVLSAATRGAVTSEPSGDSGTFIHLGAVELEAEFCRSEVEL